jgi:hypothetical protein
MSEYTLMKPALTIADNNFKGNNNRRNRQNFGVNSSGCQDTLRSLGYVPASNRSSKAVPGIILEVLDRFGNLQSNRLVLNLRMLGELTDGDLCFTYEELAAKISSIFGLVAAGVVLESIKQELQQYLLAKSATNDIANAYLIRLATKSSLRDIISSASARDREVLEYLTSCNKNAPDAGTKSLQIKARAAISEILNKIQILDTFENIAELPGGEHILLLYSKEETKDNILSSLLSSHVAKSDAGSSMLSTTWLVEKGFVDEIISLEASLQEDEDGHTPGIMLSAKGHDSTSIICAHNTSKMSREELREVIRSHRYVILDNPLLLFKRSSN